jgi:plastocyanin
MKRVLLSMIGIVACCGIGLIATSAMAIEGPSANATVSFGEWQADPSLAPLDRILADPPAGARNTHELIPQSTTIKAGGSVNFIISGGHVVAVYDDGTQPEDIDLDKIEDDCAFPLPASGFMTACSPINAPPPAGTPIAGGILSDSDGRIYRGAFLNVAPARRDGVEVVQFSKPGTYLVICARKNHFFNPTTQQFEMFGFVKVLPGNKK